MQFGLVELRTEEMAMISEPAKPLIDEPVESIEVHGRSGRVVNMSEGVREPHLQYQPDSTELAAYRPLYTRLAGLVDRAAQSDGKKPNDFRVLELGPGRGEMMRLLSERGYHVTGLDIDPECVRMSERFGRCELGGGDSIGDIFDEGEFDLVMASHVIEHLERPLDVVREMKSVSSKRVLLAVPNPVRPMVIFKSLIRRDWSNRTHVSVWDHSHFHVFLSEHAGLEIVAEEYDRVGVVWGSTRRFIHRVGLQRPLDLLEAGLMVRVAPRFSLSIIDLARINSD